MRIVVLIAIFAVSLPAQTTARENFDLGVNAFKSGNYADATERFQAALALDPAYPNALVYLSTTYVQRYIPGADTPENRSYADAAMAGFHRILDADPNNLLATQSLASLYYNTKDFPNAAEWNRRVLALDANNAAAWYTLGVLPWAEFFPADRAARAQVQMRPEDPPPLRDPVARAELKAKYWQPLTDGIAAEKQALAIDPQYSNAMAYLNLLIRYRADLDDTDEQARADVNEADAWVQKALAAQKRKASAPAAKP
jgi:tetratricopeptide (TPR) repeat protein